MLQQAEFDRYVNDYNEDYLLILRRASVGHYECLITSFLILRDLYNLIITLHDTGAYADHHLPYPFTFRGNEALLQHLGFTGEEIDNINSFFAYVRESLGKEFEQVLEEGSIEMCKRIGTK